MTRNSQRKLTTFRAGILLPLMTLFIVPATYSSQSSEQSVSIDYVSVDKEDSESTTSEKTSDLADNAKSAEIETKNADCYWNGRRYSPGARICVGGWQGPGRGMLHTCTSKGRWYNNFVACP